MGAKIGRGSGVMLDKAEAVVNVGDSAVPDAAARSSSPAWPRRRSTATESCSTRLLSESRRSSSDCSKTRVLVGSGRYLGRKVEAEAELLEDDPVAPDDPDDPDG